jgi:hypothetical protein
MEQMNIDRFREIVEAYGADPGHWPASERAAASEFSQSNATAQALLAEAAELDLKIATSESPAASFELSQTILAQGLERIVVSSSPPIEQESTGGIVLVIRRIWSLLSEPVKAPAAALWVFVAVAGVTSGAMATRSDIALDLADEELLSFYGENEGSWVEQFEPEIDKSEGEGA